MTKNIIILSIFISLLSCESEPYNSKIKYLISNASTHNITLTFFHTLDYKDTIFLISPDSIIEYNSAIGGVADSAYINFDNVKQIIYRLNDKQTRNILVEDNYMGGKVNSYLYQYIYEITDEDYANAVEIK